MRSDRSVVHHDVELTSLAGLDDGVDVEPLLDEGDETRRLDLGAASRGAGTDLDLHVVSSGCRRCAHRNHAVAGVNDD
ncbi:MAG: hypothetical protein IH849_05520 [Acidobacteria bacterium]|nr:hypothetical protein [Acidobacteriota bacterium]